MKYLKLLAILLLFTTILEAEYLRSIRIGSFKTQANAKQEQRNVNHFFKNHKKILSLQKKAGFQTITRKSGTYYITAVEPLTSRKELQVVLDTLRINYPDAYVTKLKKSDIAAIQKQKKSVTKVLKKTTATKVVPKKIEAPVKTEKKSLTEVVAKEQNSSELKKLSEVVITLKEEFKVVEDNDTQVEVNKSIVEKTPQTRVTKEVLKPVVKKEISVKKKSVEKQTKAQPKEKEDEENYSVYKILLVIWLVLGFLLLFMWQNAKRANRKLMQKEEDTLKKLNDVYNDIKDKEGYLDKSKVSLASIISHSNLLLEFDMSTIQKDYIKRILSTSGNLLNTINNTQDLDKILTGNLQIENKTFDLNRVINDVVNVFSLEAQTNNLRILIDVADDVPTILLGDDLRLKQVLINLVSNSARFTQDGDLTLEVKKMYSYVNAVTLGFKISDTGSGITDEQAREILEADSQDIKSTDLIVSKKLVEMMNGEIKIYNSQDIGTVFTFHIKFDLPRRG